MRLVVAVAVSFSGLFAGAVAHGADLSPEIYNGCCHVSRMIPLVVWDDQPGVVMRAWWLPPWRNRHYYPAGRAMAVSNGRHDEAGGPPQRAEDYERSWSAGPRRLPRRPDYRPPLPELDAPWASDQ